MNLTNKVVVITGSSSGIGKAIAEIFAKEKSKIVLNSRKNETGGQKLAEDIGVMTKTIYIKSDVGTPDGAKKLLDLTIKEFGQIDILINNAGDGHEDDFLQLEEKDIFEILKNNLLTTLYCSQYAIKLASKKSSKLKIINTSSIRGWEFGARAPIYGLSKSGVNSLTRTLAKNYAPNVLVNAVAPGFTKTPNYDSFSPDRIKKFIDQTYLHRWIDVQEMAEAYLFLAKNDAITGEIIYVDAGFRLK
jgi:NAD(P)-dependent dehydrogenase (short-subunit alcohol dehydrogenase family)